MNYVEVEKEDIKPESRFMEDLGFTSFDFMSMLGEIEDELDVEIDQGEDAARIVVNSRTGTIVIGNNVKLKPVAVTHGGLTVTVSEDPRVSQPNSFSQGQTAIVPDSQINVSEKKGKMFKFDTGATLDDLVRAVNQVGLAPGDLMSVLEALDKAGAIDGKLEII